MIRRVGCLSCFVGCLLLCCNYSSNKLCLNLNSRNLHTWSINLALNYSNDFLNDFNIVAKASHVAGY